MNNDPMDEIVRISEETGLYDPIANILTSEQGEPQSYTPEAIEVSIAEFRTTPGVTIQRIEDMEKFNVVVVYGTHEHDGGIETGALKVYRKARTS